MVVKALRAAGRVLDWLEHRSGGLVSPRFVLFCLIGGFGVGVQLAALWTFKAVGLNFVAAQALAIAVAMAANYVFNNQVTYRSRRRRGLRFLSGYLIFALACGLGALLNLAAAALAVRVVHNWWLASGLGAVAGVLFNFGAAKRLVWGAEPDPQSSPATPTAV